MRDILLSPHNDDEALFAAFVCLRYQPEVVICLRSALQETLYGVTAETREAETGRAMDILGCDWRQWPILDTEVNEDVLEGYMWGLVDPVSEDYPRIFIPLYEEGGNEQHNLVAQVAWRVFGEEHTVAYSTYTNGAIRTRPGNPVPYESEWLFLKHAALACYASQAATPSYRHFVEDLNEYLT